jgi:hypothetical protein
MPLEVIGSPRRLALLAAERERGDTCLVLPEGLPSEVEVLLDFTMKTAAVRPDVDFLIRLHPLVRRSFPDRFPRCPNVRVSDGPIEEDVANAKWCLYRGSTMAVMAVSTGVQPLYLHVVGQAVIDPLYELWPNEGTPPHAVKTVSDAVQRFEDDANDEDAVSLANQYFTQLRPSALIELVSRVKESKD